MTTQRIPGQPEFPAALGQTSFKTPINGGGARGGAGGTDQAGGASGAGAPSASSNGAAGAGAPRMVEESDIFAQSGNNLFVLNHYRGLEVIDLTNLDAPKVIGRAPIYGYPIEMYVQGTNAYALVSDYYDYWYGNDGVSWFHGSQLLVIDISNPQLPQIQSTINIDGDITDSRIVGNVMYIVSTRYSWWDNPYSNDNTTETLIQSVDISDSMNVKTVQVQSFPQGSWSQNIYVTPQAPFGIYVATGNWDENSYTYYTNVQYVDISDPNGAIKLRGQFNVTGQIPDRWSMDEYQGAFRTASGQQWGQGSVYLTTYSVTNPDRIQQLGQSVLNVSEALTSAAFDGPRGYLVAANNVDPLYEFDLSNPASPVLTGQLSINGFLDYMVPQGDRILALGHNQNTDPRGNTTYTLGVSLIDSTAGKPPALIQTVNVGADWGWVPSSANDYAKVFKVLPSGLVLMPFQSWDDVNYTYVGGVQLIDYSSTSLQLRGLIGNAGDVERGIPEDNNTVITLADDVFQVMDISNQDSPAVKSRLELSRDVQDFQPLANGFAVQLSGDWYSGDTTIAVTNLTDPDNAKPISEVHVPAPYGRMFVSGNLAYVVSMKTGGAPNYTQTTSVQVIDFTDVTNPRMRGSVTLPQPVWPGYHYWYWDYGDETMLVNPTTLAFHQFSYYWWADCGDCGGAPTGPQGNQPTHTVYLVDLSNADAPALASTTTFNDMSWAWGLVPSNNGNMLNISTYMAEQVNDQYFATYYLQQLDITDPYSPHVLPAVNIPGQFLAAAPTGSTIYTVEQAWDYTTSQLHTYIHTLDLEGAVATLLGTTEVDGYIDNVQMAGTTAFVGTEVLNNQTNNWYDQTELIAVDLSTPTAPAIASTTLLPYVDYGYLQLVQGNRAFFGTNEGILTYDVSDPSKPAFGAFYRTEGWSDELVLDGNTLFVPSGNYGVHVIQLQ